MLAAYQHFLSAGFIENGAGAAVGNFCQESGEFLIATMFRAHPDASGGVAEALKSGGIAEWLGDRKTAYIAFAGRAETRLRLAKGSLLNDLGTQCDFVVYELQTNPSYDTLYHWLTVDTGRSIATLTYNFCWIYENPAKATANLDNRVAHAEAVVAKARLLKTPQPSPPVPIPQAPPTPIILPSAPPSGPPPISASAAGRQLAVLDNLEAMRNAYLTERAAIDKELVIIETTIADFGKLASLPIPPALQIPTVDPQRKTSMSTPMSTTKPAIASTGVWGAIIAAGIPIISMIADSMGHSVDPKLQAAGSILGGLLALYGRISATSQITGVMKA
jgi:hypothetical protein